MNKLDKEYLTGVEMRIGQLQQDLEVSRDQRLKDIAAITEDLNKIKDELRPRDTYSSISQPGPTGHVDGKPEPSGYRPYKVDEDKIYLPFDPIYTGAKYIKDCETGRVYEILDRERVFNVQVPFKPAGVSCFRFTISGRNVDPAHHYAPCFITGNIPWYEPVINDLEDHTRALKQNPLTIEECFKPGVSTKDLREFYGLDEVDEVERFMKTGFMPVPPDKLSIKPPVPKATHGPYRVHKISENNDVLFTEHCVRPNDRVIFNPTTGQAWGFNHSLRAMLVDDEHPFGKWVSAVNVGNYDGNPIKVGDLLMVSADAGVNPKSYLKADLGGKFAEAGSAAAERHVKIAKKAYEDLCKELRGDGCNCDCKLYEKFYDSVADAKGVLKSIQDANASLTPEERAEITATLKADIKRVCNTDKDNGWYWDQIRKAQIEMGIGGPGPVAVGHEPYIIFSDNYGYFLEKDFHKAKKGDRLFNINREVEHVIARVYNAGVDKEGQKLINIRVKPSDTPLNHNHRYYLIAQDKPQSKPVGEKNYAVLNPGTKIGILMAEFDPKDPTLLLDHFRVVSVHPLEVILRSRTYRPGHINYIKIVM